MVGMNTADLIPDSMFVLHLHPVYVWEGPGGVDGWWKILFMPSDHLKRCNLRTVHTLQHIFHQNDFGSYICWRCTLP